MNESVVKLKKTPGRYRVTNEYMIEKGLAVLVEVDEQGRVWGLDTSTGERTHYLADDGWVTPITFDRLEEVQ